MKKPFALAALLCAATILLAICSASAPAAGDPHGNMPWTVCTDTDCVQVWTSPEDAAATAVDMLDANGGFGSVTITHFAPSGTGG